MFGFVLHLWGWLRGAGRSMHETLRDLEEGTRPSITSDIWDLPQFQDPEFLAELDRAEREWVARWNAVFALEAQAHREGRRWDWGRYSAAANGDPKTIMAMAAADRDVDEP